MSELLTNLGIDWRLLVAQIINFGILAFILKKFLWKPLLNTIAERQDKAQKIEEFAKEASLAQQKMQQEREASERSARQRSSQILQEAEAQAKILAETLRGKAEKEAKEIVVRAEQEAMGARERIFLETRADLSNLVLRASEKVLERSLTKEDDMRLAKSALEQLK